MDIVFEIALILIGAYLTDKIVGALQSRARSEVAKLASMALPSSVYFVGVFFLSLDFGALWPAVVIGFPAFVALVWRNRPISKPDLTKNEATRPQINNSGTKIETAKPQVDYRGCGYIVVLLCLIALLFVVSDVSNRDVFINDLEEGAIIEAAEALNLLCTSVEKPTFLNRPRYPDLVLTCEGQADPGVFVTVKANVTFWGHIQIVVVTLTQPSPIPGTPFQGASQPGDKSASDMLGLFAMLPYSGAEPNRAGEWVKANIESASSELDIGRARLILEKHAPTTHKLQIGSYSYTSMAAGDVGALRPSHQDAEPLGGRIPYGMFLLFVLFVLILGEIKLYRPFRQRMKQAQRRGPRQKDK